MHARLASRFYAERYREMPPGPISPEGFYQLPPVIKPELMARFDDWVTDPRVTRAGVEQFVADPDNLGQDFLGRYVVFTTSGSTGVPALLVQDRRAVAVMTGLSYVRALGALTPRLLVQMLTRQPRQAAVFATDGTSWPRRCSSGVCERHPSAGGSPGSATISVEGRTDEILRVPGTDGGEVALLPMALATVVEETPGVRLYQVLQTAADAITVRLDHDPGTDRAEVWQRVRAGLGDLLRANGAVDVQLRLAVERPQVNPRSGKLRHVLRTMPRSEV